MSFRGAVKLEQDPEYPSAYRVLEPIIYTGSRGDTIEVPVGMQTDLASVPRFLLWLVPSNGAWSIAAVVHDYMCSVMVPHRMLTRRDADGLFRRMLSEPRGADGSQAIPDLQRWLMWAAVRFASRWSDATGGERAQLVALSVLAVVAAGLPTLVVWLWLQAFRLLSFPVRAMSRP